MKKWFIPLAYPFVTVMALLLSGAVGASAKANDTGYGGIVIVLCGLLLYCVIVIPAMCILYSRYCLSGQKHRFLFTLYQSLLIGLPYYISCLISRDIDYVAYCAILFAWCEAWSLIGFVKLKPKKKEQEESTNF